MSELTGGPRRVPPPSVTATDVRETRNGRRAHATLRRRCSALAGYWGGPTQHPPHSVQIRILPGMPMLSAPMESTFAPSPSRGFTVIHPSSGPLAGKRKVTFMVALAGTTFGVADPTSRSTPSSPSATNIVAGSEVWFSTVMVQLRAFGGVGPTAGGSGGGVGVGVGYTGGAGSGRSERRHWHAGRDVQRRRAVEKGCTDPAYVAQHATCHEDRAVEQGRERGAVAAEHARGGCQRPGPRVVQRGGTIIPDAAELSLMPSVSTVPSDSSALGSGRYPA